MNLNLNNFEYLIVLALCGLIPFSFSFFHPNSPLQKPLKSLFFIIIVSIPWLIWDVIATDRGHWSFNSDYYLEGLKIWNLPIEEISFFIVIPFCCLFLWTTIKQFSTFSDLIKKTFSFKKIK